jgi:hypothetical protein
VKNTSLLLVLFFLSFITNAQDLIIRKNGDKIRCSITNEDSANIYIQYTKNFRQIESYIAKQDIEFYRLNNKHSLPANKKDQNLELCFTTGFMYGGGAIFGFDIERKLYNRFSFQHGRGYSATNKQESFNMGLLHLGTTFISYSAGLNYHLKETLRSSFISFQYLSQGAIFEHKQKTAGPAFVYRGKKWFTAQVGLGYVLSKSREFEYNYNKSPFKITYAFGFYLIN